MRKLVVISILAIALASASLAGEKKNTYISEDLGISIEVPMSKESKAPSYQVAIFLLSASDGFAANVNIQKQKYSASIEAYDNLTVRQFKNFKFNVLERKRKDNEVTYEYKGYGQGKSLHWYARAIKQGKHVYLVTATGLDSHWSEQKAELMNSVNSFKVEK